MKREKKDLGDFGERVSLEYLKRKKYKILGTKVRVGRGEIDIVCKKGKIYVFIEVKTRSSEDYEDILDSVSFEKEESLIQSCEDYMQKNSLDTFEFRIDLIGMVLKGKKVVRFEHVIDYI